MLRKTLRRGIFNRWRKMIDSTAPPETSPVPTSDQHQEISSQDQQLPVADVPLPAHHSKNFTVFSTKASYIIPSKLQSLASLYPFI